MDLNNDYKKLYKYLFSFIFLLTIILYSLEYALSKMVSNSDKSWFGKINLVQKEKIDPNILILGSSVAEVGLDPNLISQLTNKTAYNSAIDGTSYTNSDFLSNKFLSYTKNCEQIIIGVSPFTFSEPRIQSIERILAFSSHKNIKKFIFETRPDTYKKLYNIPFYSFILSNHIYYKNSVIGLKNFLTNKEIKADNLNGFKPNYSKYSKTISFNDKLEISDNAIDKHKNVLQKILQKDIEPIIILMPVHINGKSLFSNFNEYVETVKNIANQLDIKLFDYTNHKIIYSDKFFYNNSHLNFNGSQLITNDIVNKLYK